jgi:transposase
LLAGAAWQCAIQNLVLLNAILYVAGHGCKWRGLPTRFGNWHSIYVRMNRWSKKGVLDQVFAKLQQEQILRIKDRSFQFGLDFGESEPRWNCGI